MSDHYAILYMNRIIDFQSQIQSYIETEIDQCHNISIIILKTQKRRGHFHPKPTSRSLAIKLKLPNIFGGANI